MPLQLYPLRFAFRAIDSLYFPPGKSANILRGAFGEILRATAGDALYQRMFAPAVGRAPSPAASPSAGQAAGRPLADQEVRLTTQPSGFADSPRPFVLRTSHLDGCRFAPGSEFHFGFPLFDTRKECLEAVSTTFARLAEDGLGPGRGRAELIAVHGDVPLSLSLDPADAAVNHLTVRFVTPTELKTAGELAERPEFPILAARLRDRISALRTLYGDGPLTIDFRGFAERAAKIRMTRCDVRHESVQRRSTRTGQTHPLGGFTGEAEYEGDLREFLPYLQAARWTGVGRQTVWGKGELDVH
jgi:hypothetical protein